MDSLLITYAGNSYYKTRYSKYFAQVYVNL